MRTALHIFVILIAFCILWEKPLFLIELGKTNEGILFYIALLALSVYASPIAGVLVGAIVIFLIKEGCDCAIHVAKSIESEISNGQQRTAIHALKNAKAKTKAKTKSKMPMLTACVLKDHSEGVVDFECTDIIKFPNLPHNSYDDVSVFTNDNTDILHKSERLKPMCSRIY